MSIESKEIKDIYALYQNINENSRRDEFRKNVERIKNPFKNTTIVTKDGKELKQGDEGFEKELANARKTLRDANNKSLGKTSSQTSNSDTVTSKGGTERTVKKSDDGKGITITKKDLDSETDEMIANTPTIKDRKFGGTGTKTVYNKDGSKTITKGHSDDIGTGSFGGKKASSDEGKKLLNTKDDNKKKVITKGGPGPQGGYGKKSNDALNAMREKKRVEKIKSNQPAPTEKDLEDAKKEADTANAMKSSGKYKEVKKDGGTVLQKVKKPDPNNNKLDTTPIKKPVDTPVKKPIPVAKPKITARSLMRQRNIDRFGADKVNKLQQQQRDFKTMQAKSQMPGAKPGAAKAEFAKKNPDSNIAKDLKKSKRVTQVMDLESYDTYDLVLMHLLETNQVDSVEEANYVMTEMDGKTILEIKKLMESMPDYVRDSIGRQYGTGKYKGQKYTIEDKKNVINWYSRIKA
tara:strand:+ start:1260 stop:2645 length:1386 start_codon:yes stop_codon:yes gene_type:complete